MIHKRIRWSKGKVIKELRKVRIKVGHSPSVAEIKNTKKGLYRACGHYFGSSNKAKKKARLKINCVGSPIKYSLPKKAYSPSKELAWLIGYILGDGYLTTNNIIGMKTKDREIKDLFIKTYTRWCGHKNFGVRYEKERIHKFSNGIYKCKRIWVIRVCSKETHFIFKKFKEDPLYCLNFFPEEYWKFLLKGLWDAEGSISLYSKNHFRISFANYDNEILKLFEKLCLNLHFNIYKSEGKINIGKLPDVLNFIDEIGVTIKRKIKKFNKKIDKFRSLQNKYYKVIQLRSEGVSRMKIARLNKEIPISTIEKWIYDERVPYYISYRFKK